MRTSRILQAIFWIAVYIALTIAPLLILLTGPQKPDQGFWERFSVALGFAGLAMMSLQFVLTARFKVIKAPYGSDVVYHFHRQISLVAFVLILAMIHVILVGYYIYTLLKEVLWTAYGAIWILLLLYVRILKPFLLLRKPYQIEQVVEERGNTWTLHIKPVGHMGMRFQPGQFAWLTFGQSPFSGTEHPFSFSSNAEHTNPLTFTIKELGDFTSTVKDLPVGQPIYLDGPFGIFSIDHYPDAKSFVLIAGGVGITPMMSMLRTEAKRGDTRPLLLIYAVDTWEVITFREEIEELTHQLKLEVVHVLRNPTENWKGESGTTTTFNIPCDCDRRRDCPALPRLYAAVSIGNNSCETPFAWEPSIP